MITFDGTTGKFGIDYAMVGKLLSDLWPNRGKISPEAEFLVSRRLYRSARGALAAICADTYERNGFERYPGTTLIKLPELQFDRPVVLRNPKRSEDHDTFAFDVHSPLPDVSTEDLPLAGRSFVHNLHQIEFGGDWTGAPIRNEGHDLTYRLIAASGRNLAGITYSTCTYRDYLNTCELNAFRVAREVFRASSASIEKVKSKKNRCVN